jgi:ATP-dependent helicase/nuclease subunit A
MKLTPSQQRAIAHRGSNLLVSASAGSGKTEVLARRVVELVADPRQPCAIERLLVVTFTRAAAAELRVRIARMLRKAADKTCVRDLQSHLRRQEVLVDAADIGTIDAWCSRIVRAHAALTGVDAEFSTLSEEDAGLLRGRVLDELFTWIYSADEPLALAAREWLGLGRRPDDVFLRDLIAGLNGYRAHVVEMEAWFERQRVRYGAAPEELRADARRVLTRALVDELTFQNAQLGELLDKLAGCAPADALQGYRDELAAWHRALTCPAGSAADLAGVAAQVDAYRLRKPRGLSNAPAALFEEVRERWLKGRLKDRWSPQHIESSLEHAPAAAQLVNALLGLEQRYEELLSAAKRSAGVAEFHDVLRWALDLLGTPAGDGPRQPTELARQLQKHYEHILVDEYQDTSPVQVELLRLVTRSAPDRSNRFMVGDVKQSIYGFRQAEPRLFTELVRSFAAGRQEGEVCYLADNFRSQRDLVAGLNRMFAQLFDPSLGGTAFEPVERLQAARADRPNPTLDAHPRLNLHLLDDARGRHAGGEAADAEDTEAVEDELPPLERIEREALVAAAEIQRMLSAGVHIPQREADDSITLRPLQYGDVVILLRAARQNAGVVARVLRDAGIPCVTSGRDALLAAPEVMDIRNALALLANRRQDVPLAAYLRSPLVGLSAAELLEVRAAAPKGDFHAAVMQYVGDDGSAAAKVQAGLAQLDRWAELAREEELPELLRRIYADTDWLLFAQALPGGPHRVSLLRALHGYAVDFARQGHHGVAEFDAYLEDLAKAELAPGTPVAAGADVVRIMTIHAAKGLEFPVVLLLSAGARLDRRDARETLLCDEELGLGLRYADYHGRRELVTATHHVLSARTSARSVEEELRLLYVAATRARERLLICGHAPAGAWEEARERFTDSPPPLATRLSAGSMLEWVIMAAAAAGLDQPTEHGVPLMRIERHAAGLAPAGAPAPPRVAAPDAWSDANEQWLTRAGELLATARSSAAADIPAVVAVSTLKELAITAHDGDIARTLPAMAEYLQPPAFARSTAEPDGRVVGHALHCFLEHADLANLAVPAAVRGQLERLVSAGRISAEQAGLVPVEDVGWFAGTELGRLLAEHAGRLRRELPFVCAWPVGGEVTILRGVIDCLVETQAGLIIVDYKTDRVSDPAALAERAAKYTTQLQIYAAVAARILDRPVSRALLVFLRPRRLIEVSCGSAAAAVDLLAALAPAAP